MIYDKKIPVIPLNDFLSQEQELVNMRSQVQTQVSWVIMSVLLNVTVCLTLDFS